MAEFNHNPSTSEEILNLIKPQTKPRFSNAAPFAGQKMTKYDEGLSVYDTANQRRELNYLNQTGWQAWGNALGQSLAEVTAGTLEGFGYLLDLEQHVKALAGTEKEFDNEFSKAMREFKESVREEAPVFTDPNKPFDPLNSRWWASNLPSITSTLTLMIPTGAAVGAIGKLGKVGKALTSTNKILGGLTSGRAITSGAISRVLESTMEAAGNADQVYKELISQGKSEEEARTEAGKVASNTYYANLPLMLSDMFEYSVLFRNKGVDAAVDSMNKQAKKSLLKNSLAVGGSFLSEGLEEGYQYGVGEEAKKSKNAAETMGNVVSNFGEYFDDPEFLSSVVVGGMSGAGFQALGNVIESRSAKLANVFPEFNGEALNALAASTGASVANLKVLGQAAFTKFKGNLKEALADIDSTIKNLPADVKDTTREAYKLGLQSLKEAANISDEFLQKIEPEKASDAMWNGAKEKINTAIGRIRKWAGINEKIQQLEAEGNEAQAEVLRKEEFVKLLEVNTEDAEKYITQAQESGIDTTEYEDIYNTYKEGLVQHKGNADAAQAEVQAEIRRQAKQNLLENINKLGTKYADFDFNSLRAGYLEKEGSPEAKILKAGIEPDKTKNNTVPKGLKAKVKQLVDLDLEELRLTKQADKLDTTAGQEELAAKKKEDKIAEIKKSSDPEVLFNQYEDEDLAKVAKSRVDKLIKEEFDVLPNPNSFIDYNDFKEAVNSPVLSNVKNDPAIDKALIQYYNDNTLSNEKPVIETFEDSEFEKVAEQVSKAIEEGYESIPEFESELPDYKELNDQIQENLEESGDFMLHSQLWSMSRDKSGDWNLRKFNKDAEGNNKRNRTSYNDWTDDEFATEELFNNFGDYRQYEVFFEVHPKEWVDWETKEKRTTNIYNHWIRLFVIKDGKKIYIGQLQDTAKTAAKPKTNTKALNDLRLVADEALKTLKPGESKVIGSTRIVNYYPGLYNNLAKPRDAKAALTDEELDNLGVGVYMGQHEELGLMKTNRPEIRNIKPVNAKPGSVYVAKKTPTGEWQWFACITKNLREMPELVQKVKDLLAPFEDPTAQERIKSPEFIRTTLAQLRSIVRYKVNDKLEPDFNSKIVNVKAYHVDGKFNVGKFIEVHGLLDRKVQIDPKRLEEEGYAESILDRLITDIDRIPFVNPFITVAPPETKVLNTPETETKKVIQETPTKLEINRSKKKRLVEGQRVDLYKGQINIEQALRELKRIVPNGYTVNILKGLIESEGVSAYGMVHDAAITLSEKAPFGTEYHEAWHAIEQVLPKFQYDRLKSYMTEEDRADAFAEYMMTNQAPSLLKRIFQLVKAFIQDLINYHPSLLDLFDRANAGYYKNKKIGRYGTFYKIDGLTERNKQDLVNVYLAEVGEEEDFAFKKNIEKMIDSDPVTNGLTTIKQYEYEGKMYNPPLVNFIAEVEKVKGLEEANKLLSYFRKDLSVNEEGLFVSTGTPEFGALYPELLKALGKRGYKIVLGKTELDITLGEERELEDGEAFEDAETNTLEGWQESASLRSPIEKLSKRMKQLIYSIRSNKKDSLGLGMNLTYNGYEAYSRLASVIVDSIDVEDMMKKLRSRTDTFFENLLTYIDEEFASPENTYTELYKALGDKTQPQFWVTQEVEDEYGGVSIRLFEANRAGIKSQVKNMLGDYKGDNAQEFLTLLDMQDVFISYTDLKTALKVEEPKARFLAVWKILGSKMYSKFIASHLNVEGKKQYEIINGGFFSKLTQRLQRDFEGIKAELFNKDPFLKELPILQTKPKAGDFQFVIYAGYKDVDGKGLMYNNYTEKEFVTSTFRAWMGKEKIHMMPILSDSPNLIGVRYRIPEGDREEMLAKIIHLERKRSKDTHGIKNYNPEVNIFEEIPYRENLNEQILEVQKYFDNAEKEYIEYANRVGANIQLKSNDNPNLVRSYLLEHAIVHSQMSILSVGHLSFYKNLEDYYKRAKEIWSPVIKGNVDNYFMDGDTKIEVFSKKQRVNVLPTVESPSSQVEELESIGFNDYRKVDKTDAQSEIDLISYRDRMITLNEWTPKHQKAFVKLAKGEMIEEVGLFNVLKPFYFNMHVVDGELVSPVQKKDSELLILPIYGLEKINGQPNILYNPLWKKHLEMMGYNFDTMSYDEQGRKEGKYYDIITYDTTIKVGKRSEMVIDLANWGKQQETPEHHYMSDAIFGTQIMKLITGNLEGNYNVDGASVSAKALWKEYNDLVSEWTIENYNRVVQEYGSEAKLKRMIIEEMINKGMRDDYIRSVQQLPLTHPIHFNKVIQIINSFAKNNITDLKFDKGYTMANASSEGFQRELKIKWVNDDPKQGIDHFEVFAPIHDKRVRDYIVDGVVDMDALRADIKAGKIPDLLSGLVYRIPTEGKYSMFKIKIVGFLPVDNGVIFMPDMVTKIAGLDFDIDKVRGFFLGGNQKQDRILKLMMAVLSSPASLKEQLTPGGFDNLKNNNLLIRAYKAGINPEGKTNKELEALLKDKMPFFSPITLSKIARRMMVGKALIGTAANANAVHSLMEAYATFDVSEYNDGVQVIYNGEVLESLSRKYDTEGNLISANIAELLAAFVDNGKDPQAEYSNITSDTIGTALYLLKKGVPLKAVQFFMTQVNLSVVEATNKGFDVESKNPFEGFTIDNLENDLKKETSKVVNYASIYSSLAKGASKFEAYVAGVKVANAGAGATMVDNYLKIKKYKKALNINRSVINDSGLTKTLIEKGLTEWNDFIVNTFKVPDVNKGTIVQALNILSDQVLKYVSDDTIKDLYNSFINYVASGYFKYDPEVLKDMTNLDKLMTHKLKHPDNKFLNRLEINKDGYLQFIGANTNDELEIQSIIDDWDNLINSTDADTSKFGNDLIKYSFYQRGFDFGMGSFGHLIPVSYFIKNTEFTKYFTETMRALDQPNQEKANAFVEQYIANNYIDVQLPIARGELVEEGILKVDFPPSVDGKNVARYIKFEGVPYKYAGDGTYRLLPVRAKYVGTNKYIQRYDFDAKPKQYVSRPSEKKYVTQSIDVVANTLEKLEVENQVIINSTDKNVVVPEGSSGNNLPIFTTDNSIFLMNDQQQAAHDEIFKFISEKLDDRSTDQTPLKISKLGTGSIPKGVYDNSIGLLGKGGTGKTSMLKVLIENIKQEKSKGYNRVNVRYIAPTHTAATMLQEALGFDSERTGEGVSTFASFVGRNQLKGSPDGIPENSDLLLVKDDIWLKQIEMGITIPVSSADIVVIDESSMISNTMLQNFMQRFNAEGGSQLPIFIFMGDYRQLPPVEETKEKFSEGVVSATIFANSDKYVELTQVMRSKDKELHRVYDSVGQQITQQRNQILSGQTPDKFDWKKYDDVTSKSTSNILITQERQVDQVIEDYTKQLVEQDNPYHIFWTHYNKLNHQRTQVLFNKIRNTYFKKLGVTDVKPGVMVNDYVQYTQSLPLPTLNGKYGEINVVSGELKPGSRYKVKDLRKEAVNVSDISDTLLDYFGGVTMNMDKIYLVNRKDQLRYTMLFEKGAITAGTYNKETKTIPVTIRTSEGVSLTKEVAYRDFFSLKSYVASAKKGIDGIFEPSYIGSTHTVQGASIKTIIVGDYNIRQNQGSVDMRDIESSLYTALTRSAGKLVIIKPNVVPIENNQEVFSYTLQTPDSVVPSQEKVMFKGQMTYSYGTNKRSDVVSASTFEAIQKGERTATTRYESQGNVDYWKNAKVGDVIEFSDGKGNTVQVRVTKPLHKLQGSGKTAEQWSKLEGWSVAYFNSKVKPKLSEAWQIEYELVNKPTVKGEEISSYSDNLAFALTNPVFTSPTGQEWKREWKEGQKKWREYMKGGIVFDGVKYRDVEQAYQKNKEKYPIGEARDNFMLQLLEIKLKTYPKLVEGIDAKGGVNYLKNSTHQPTKQNSHWETGGDNAFIKLLTQAYMNVKGLGKMEGTQLNMFEQEKPSIEIVTGNWSRDSVTKDSNSMYIFTDNTDRSSAPNATTENVDKNSWYYKKYKSTTSKPIHFGSVNNPTSAVIRGLNNAYPISTVKSYGQNWKESEFEEFKKVIDNEIEQIKTDLPKFQKLKIGNFRIGQGGKIAKIPAKLQAYLDNKLLELGIDNSSQFPKIQGQITTFTQEMVDKLNDITKDLRTNGFVYTMEYLNNLPEERKKKAYECYVTGQIPK